MNGIDSLPSGPGVYLITCEATGDSYVGCSKCVSKRVCNHRDGMRIGRKFRTNINLIDLAKQHGLDAFSVRCLKRCGAGEEFLYERRYIRKLKPSLNGTSHDHGDIVCHKLSGRDMERLKWSAYRSNSTPELLVGWLIRKYLATQTITGRDKRRTA